MEHTPTPWENNGGQIEGLGGYPNVIAVIGKVNEQTHQDTANARFIVQAVNAYDDLLAACRCWSELWNMYPLDSLDSGEDMQHILRKCWKITQAAIAKAIK